MVTGACNWVALWGALWDASRELKSSPTRESFSASVAFGDHACIVRMRKKKLVFVSHSIHQ